MNTPFPTTEEYRAALLVLGEAAFSAQPREALQERYEAFCAREAVSAAIVPTFALLREALHLAFPEAMCVAVGCALEAVSLPALTPRELLARCREIGGQPPSPALSSLFIASGNAVSLHPIVVDFLFERAPRLPGGLTLTVPQPGKILHTQGLFEELSTLIDAHLALEEAFPLVIALCGEEGCGRGYIISKLCAQLGAALLTADLRARPPMEELLLTARLYGAMVSIENAIDSAQLEAITSNCGLVFARCASDNLPPQSSRYTVLSRALPKPDSVTREAVLAKALGRAPNAEHIPSLERFSLGQVRTLGLRLRAEEMATGKPAGRQLVTQLLRELPSADIPGAARLECAATLADLVLPAELMRQLAELCAFLKNRETVLNRWGFGAKIPWGRGVSALFYGAPGTGKTLAAAAVANEAGLPLLRVDLSQLTSKYIGETQKNIGGIFKAAARTGSVLFFDEADALFAKRTEAADAQDKYANAETAYLLQRIEGHDGACLLATNLLQNFDEAFRRRIGYMLHFPLPDAGQRELIWRSVFPTEAPLGNLNYAELARQLELSGASIKNCALHGAYRAASAGTAITMEYLLEGAKNEYQKLGKTISAQVRQMLGSHCT